MAADTFKWNTGSDYWKLGDCFNDSLSAIAPDGALYYEAMIALTLVCVVATILAAQPTTAATLSGTVTDASGKPIPDARLDHAGRMVTVAATALAVAPSPDEIRPTPTVTFELRPVTPVVIIRKPGFASQLVRVTGDAQVQITLQPTRTQADTFSTRHVCNNVRC